MTMENNKPENERPKNIVIDFPNCPHCGSEKRLANEVLLKEKAKGKMPQATQSFLFMHESIIAVNMNWITAQKITAFYDSCTECGTTWCIHAEEKTVMQGAKQAPGSLPPQFSSN